MQYIRKSNERGTVDLGWLHSRHSFSFGQYYDPEHMGISVLRVLNDDVVKPNRGFGTHGHKNMEIISFVVNGALKHSDSTGNDYVIPEGDIQVMSAGKGIQHSEMNASDTKDVNFIQIWIEPNVTGITPQYSQKSVNNRNGMELLVSGTGRQGSLQIHQNAQISKLQLQQGQSYSLMMNPEHNFETGYLHVVSGEITVTDPSTGQLTQFLNGDAMGLLPIEHTEVQASENTVALWFELP